MSNPDQTQRFLFEHTPIRGEITGLEKSYQEVLSKHNYPKPVQRLLGEFMAAVSLLSDTLKFEGILSLQVRGAGQVRLLMAECRHNRAVRAIARYNDDFVEGEPMLGAGQMAITLEPEKGQRYQGITAIDDDTQTLNRALEDYFRQSEQIRTRIWLRADGERAAGVLIQAIPKSAEQKSLDEEDEETWNRVIHLAETLTADELLGLDNDTLLNRLFHEEEVRVFDQRALRFECTCSRERCGESILTLGREEALDIVEQEGALHSDCQFCHEQYWFNKDDVEALFKEQRKGQQ